MARKHSSPKARSITLRDVIAHIQGVKNELMHHMEMLRKALTAKMDGGFKEMRSDIAALRSDLSAEQRMRRTQIDNIDERLTDVEINRLPKIERKVFS